MVWLADVDLPDGGRTSDSLLPEDGIGDQCVSP